MATYSYSNLDPTTPSLFLLQSRISWLSACTDSTFSVACVEWFEVPRLLPDEELLLLVVLLQHLLLLLWRHTAAWLLSIPFQDRSFALISRRLQLLPRVLSTKNMRQSTLIVVLTAPSMLPPFKISCQIFNMRQHGITVKKENHTTNHFGSQSFVET